MRTFILVPIGALALASCLAEFPHTSQPSATASLNMLTLSFAWSQTQIPILSTSTAPSATATLPRPSATPTVPPPLAAGEHLVYAQYEYPGIEGDPYLMQFKLAPVEDLARARTLPSAYEGSMAPDGHRFAFINGEGAWIYEVTTEQVTPIDHGEDGKLIQWNTCTTPAWSPGGSRFLTNCRRLHPFDYLVLIEFMPSTGVDRIVPGTEGCLEPTFSPSDTIVIAECIDPNGLIPRSNNLFVIDLESGRQVPFPACESIKCTSPVWSPTGEYVAVMRSRGSSGPLEDWVGLYLVPAACFWKPIPCEGSLLGPIALPNLYAWSPDGSRLALEEGIDTLEVFTVRSRTSIKYEKTFRSIYDIRWSLSGRWIAISAGPSDDLLVFDAALNYFTSLSAEKVSFYPYSWIWIR